MKFIFTLFSSLVLLSATAFANETSHDLDLEKSVVSWKGEKVAGAHNGTLKVKSGAATFTDGVLTGGSFTLDMASIVNLDVESPKWRAKLENHLKSDDFFNVSQYPEGKFVITKAEPQADGYLISGDLTIKNKTHAVSFPATVSQKGDSYHALANVKIDRLKWDIKYNSGKFFDPKKLGDKLIYDEIEIGLDLMTK